jgi:sensor histidine kinase YesM
MKQLLFTLILFLSGINILLAQETNSIEETTWNVIRERLFSGENSKAYRFEEDIRFQLKGEFTKEDSLVIQNIISELKDLIEIVDVKLVNENGNFIITIHSSGNGTANINYDFFRHKISDVKIGVNGNEIRTFNEKEKYFSYHIFYYLTRTFAQRKISTTYGGVFDSPFYRSSNTIKNIDKDLIRMIYSKDFYKQLKLNTERVKGYLFYLNLRYENLMKNLLFSIKIILIILGFLYFLSKDSTRVKHPTFWVYVKQRTIILLIIPFVFSFVKIFVKIDGNFQPLLISHLGFFVINFILTVSYALLVFAIIFYTEPFFLKKINGFAGKQSFIFLSTILSVLISPLAFILLILFTSILISLSNIETIKFTTTFSNSLMLQDSSFLFLIAFTATLRVFYNFINYRIQSMVNQKDVELAKMKELKNQAELNALHSRINPHFLYNSLNSIAGLAQINPDKTENMAVALSEIFRYSINKENKTFVKVEEELEMVKKYLEIEKTRFEDKLNYTIVVDETVKEKLIPKFLIQPLAENAIKHGLSKIKEPGRITIEVKQLENDLVITIFDNGPDFPEEPVSGYGLQNLNDKLEIIYGKDANINWENGNNKHIRITIKNQFKG